MSGAFEVHSVSFTLPGTLADGIPFPLFKVPASGGAITILEATYCVATAIVAGTANLIHGTLVGGSNGTVVPVATIGTSFGTGGGTYPALTPVSLSINSAVVPAGSWVAFRIGTMAAAGQNSVNVAYVQGR